MSNWQFFLQNCVKKRSIITFWKIYTAASTILQVLLFISCLFHVFTSISVYSSSIHRLFQRHRQEFWNRICLPSTELWHIWSLKLDTLKLGTFFDDSAAPLNPYLKALIFFIIHKHRKKADETPNTSNAIFTIQPSLGWDLRDSIFVCARKSMDTKIDHYDKI